MSWVDLPIFAKLIGGSPDPRPADEAGDISERLSYVVGALAIPGQRPIMGLPGYYTLPISKTILGADTLNANIAYFRNLTISAGQVLTGAAGGTIIVVENTLTFEDATSQISVNALGAKPGTGTAAGAGRGGGGGGTGGESGTNFGYSADNTTATLPAPVLGVTDATLSTFFADGGAAWSAALGADRIDGWGVMFYLLDLMQKRGKDSAANGGIGGGGGGGGGTGNVSGGTAELLGTMGSHGGQGGTARTGGGGGSGFGGGGRGGHYTLSTAGGGTGATGGRGGGVLVVIAKYIVSPSGGLITADGGVGGTGSSTVSSGGGGGGGCAVLFYETLTGTIPTVRANGGAAGSGASGNAGAGAAGGNGLAFSHQIRAGI